MPVGRDGNSTFSVITGALASAVATSGTFTTAYPSGKDASNFFLAMGHKIVIGSDVYFYPVDFDVTLGTTTITVTNKGTPTWPAAATFRLQVNEQGERAMLSVPLQDPNNQIGVLGTTQAYGTAARSKLIPSTTAAFADLVTLGAPITASANSICLAQSKSSSGALTMAGALVSGGVGTFDVPRGIQIVSTGADTAVITVTGTDVYSQTMSEAITLNGATVVNGKKAFKTVTAVACSAAIANLATVGHTDLLGLPVFLPSAGNIVAELRNGAVRTGGFARVDFSMNDTELATPVNKQLVSPINGKIVKLLTICDRTIVTGGDITVNVGATAVSGLTVNYPDSTAPGTVRSDYPDNPETGTTSTVVVGSRIQIVASSTFATSGAITGMVEIAGTNGLVVAGVRTAGGSTTTTGDVRGTYLPDQPCNGVDVLQLLCILPDRGVGIPQA